MTKYQCGCDCKVCWQATEPERDASPPGSFCPGECVHTTRERATGVEADWRAIPGIVRTAFEAANGFRLEDTVVLFAIVGSRAHGTWMPKPPGVVDDIDMVGVVVPPPEKVLTLSGKQWDSWRLEGQYDVTIYSARRYLELLAGSNPDVLVTLWLRPEDHLIKGAAYQRLIAHRDAFSSLALHDALEGYAASQIRRMEVYTPAVHQQWLDAVATIERAGWTLDDILQNRSRGMPIVGAVDRDGLADAVDTIKRINAQHFHRHKGEKRRALIQQHGYDTANAMHGVRLMRMCCEFLHEPTTGTLQVCRTDDAEELKAIKRGEWTLGQLHTEIARLMNNARVFRTWVEDKKALPATPDQRLAERILLDLYRDSWEIGGTGRVDHTAQRMVSEARAAAITSFANHVSMGIPCR